MNRLNIVLSFTSEKKVDWIYCENGNFMSFIQVLAQLSHLFNKHLLSAYFVPGKGAGVIAIERKDKIS